MESHSTSKEIIEATARKARVGVISTCRLKPQPKFTTLLKILRVRNEILDMRTNFESDVRI